MLALCLVGCQTEQTDERSDVNVYPVNGITLHPFDYHGHGYLLCHYHNSAGIIHDPDCAQCKQHNREEDGK